MASRLTTNRGGNDQPPMVAVLVDLVVEPKRAALGIPPLLTRVCGETPPRGNERAQRQPGR